MVQSVNCLLCENEVLRVQSPAPMHTARSDTHSCNPNSRRERHEEPVGF